MITMNICIIALVHRETRKVISWIVRSFIAAGHYSKLFSPIFLNNFNNQDISLR